MSFYLYFSVFIVEAHSTRSDPQPITLCTKGPDLQIPSIEAKQDGTLGPNYPLAAECQIRPQRYGGGQGEPVPDSIGDSPISPDTPTRPILGTEEVIEVARGE